MAASSRNMMVSWTWSCFVVCFIFSDAVGLVSDITEVEENELHALVTGSGSVCVYFYSGECNSPRCKSGLETIGKLEEHVQDLKVIKINSVKKGMDYGIKEFPQLLFFRKAYPALYTGSLDDVEELLEWLSQAQEIATQSLTDDSFEHLTQSASGATTGDWFVIFYHPKCNTLLATWEAIAMGLKHKMNIARVNMAKNPGLQRRFSIKKCPTIFYFRLGKMYEYDQKDRSFNNLVSFAEGWYTNVKVLKVPTEPTPFDSMLDSVVLYLKDLFSRPWGRAKFVGGAIAALCALGGMFFLCIPDKRKRD